MDLLTPPPDGDRDRGPAVVSLYWTIFGLSLALLCLRFWARFRIHAIGWDDWIMALAVVCILIEYHRPHAFAIQVADTL